MGKKEEQKKCQRVREEKAHSDAQQNENIGIHNYKTDCAEIN